MDLEEIYSPSPGKRESSVVMHVRLPRSVANAIDMLLDQNQGRIPWKSSADVARSCIVEGLKRLEDGLGAAHSPMWRVSEFIRAQMTLAADDAKSVTQFAEWAKRAIREGHVDEVRSKWVTIADLLDRPNLRAETRGLIRATLNNLAPALGLTEIGEDE